MIRWIERTVVLDVLLIGLMFLASGCALNVRHDDVAKITHVDGRIGLKDATILDFNADLPAMFTGEVNSDVGSWLVARALEASMAGGNVLLDAVKWVGGWFKIGK